ncbi:MAG: response regulator [Pirellulaceae bacterium]|nr:response regulator [Pirellulaceae bacterium]
MERTLDQLQVAALILDTDYRICSFTSAATELYGLIESDIGRPLAQLRPLVQDMPPIPAIASLDRDHPVEDLVRSETGKTFIRRVSPFEQIDGSAGIAITFVDVTRFYVSQDEVLCSHNELEQQSRRLNTITDATPAMIAYVSTDLRYEFVNQRYADQFGKTPQELRGQDVAGTLGNDSFGEVKRYLEASLSGTQSTFKTELQIQRDGSNVFEEVTFVPDTDDAGVVVGCHIFAIDITERKHSELAIADREERLAAVTERMSLAMEAAGMGSFEWDPKTDSVQWDEQHLAISGLRNHKDTRGKEFLHLIHPEDVAQNKELIERAIATRGDYAGAFRIIRPDGETRWLAARARMVPSRDGSGDRLVGLNWDITDQRNSLEQVKLAEERLRLAAEAAGFGTYQIDLVTGRTYWSAEYKNLVGASDDADKNVRAAEVADFVHPDDRKQVARHLSRAKRALDGGIHSFTHRILLPDGSQRWVRRQGQTVLSPLDGQPIKIIGTLLDITAQKEVQQSLEEARRVAEAANESKSEFLANMSHEIRTPMSAIMGYTDILSRQLTDPDDIKCASVIRHNGKFLLEIINDILDISKIEAGKLELNKKRFRPDRLVADVCSLMEIRAAEKGIPLEVSFDGEIPKTIRSDDKRLKQILVNLIGNALKFTKSGTVHLVVSCKNADQPTTMQFDVIDTGIGMDAKQLKNLFVPFTQGDSSVVRKFEGTGLGLSISQRLARMLGGEITVESTLRVGSRFTLVIDTGSLKNVPRIEPVLSTSRIASPAKPSQRPDLQGRILVVDDRRDMIFLTQHLIEDAGGTVVAAENGSVAIERIEEAEKAGRPFDLITMDMQMPVLDGYEATRRLRQAGCEAPIIAVTAHAMQGDRQKCIEAGCTDYITKPLDGPSFLALLAEHLKRRRRGGRRHHTNAPPNDSSVNTTGPSSDILVIDDAQDACGSLKTLLEFSGHRVDVAHDGQTGIDKVTQQAPAVVILDLGLPDMSGFDVIRALKQNDALKETVFIAATGRENESETRAAGFDHHFVKPIDIARLESLLDDHFANQLVGATRS